MITQEAARKTRGRPRQFDRHEALETALRLFWDKGYDPTTLAELCEAMQIKTPSLYAAYGNKEALFLEAAHYYEETYWAEPARRFMSEPDIYTAVANYFQEAAQIMLAPDAPAGSLTILAAINISAGETKIIEELGKMRARTREMFSDRMRLAIEQGQIPADTDVPAVAGSLAALLEGLALQARDKIFLSQLKAMAALAPRLLPPQKTIACPQIIRHPFQPIAKNWRRRRSALF